MKYKISKLLAIGFLCLSTGTILAQSDLSIIKNEKIIGKNYNLNNDIQANEYLFPERIQDSKIDSISNLLTVQLRGVSKNGKWLNNSGNIVLYDLSKNTSKWSKKINYQNSNIEQFNNVIIQTIVNKSYCLNIENGEHQWEAKNDIYYVDSRNKIGIGYKTNSFSSNTNSLEGIDLTNGNSVWQREINREYGWNDIRHLNDSIIVVLAAGLHTVNLKNGTGWDYNTITGKKDYTETIAANAAGVVLGVLTGTFAVSTGHNLVRNINSNVLIDSSNIYFASKESIVKLDTKGNVIWSNTLPKDKVSKSSIFIKNNNLYIINKGYAFMGNRQLNFGKPFIASYDINTGKQSFLNETSGDEKQINGFQIGSETVLLIFNDKVSKYSLISGLNISEKIVDITAYGELQNFVSDEVYIKSDSTYNNLVKSDSTKYYLLTSTNKALVINQELEIINTIDTNQLYVNFLKTKNQKFLYKENETTIIDDKNKKIADLKLSGNAILLGSKLYDIQEKSFIVVDINQF